MPTSVIVPPGTRQIDGQLDRRRPPDALEDVVGAALAAVARPLERRAHEGQRPGRVVGQHADRRLRAERARQLDLLARRCRERR